MKHIILLFLFIPFFTLGQSNVEKAKAFIVDKNYIKAEHLLLKYVATHENDKESIELLGDTYGHQKKWDEASVYFKKLVELEPPNANFHYKYGGAQGMKALEMNKLAALTIIGDVKAAFLKAAELDPNHIETRWALVELYMQLPGIIGGSKRKALKYAEELQKLSTVDGYLAKGYIYEYEKKPELAEKFYKKSILEGGSFNCYEKLTTLYENEKQPEKAISNMEEARETHKRNAMHYQIGKVCAEYNIQLEKGENYLLAYISNYSVKDGVPKAWAYYRLAQIERYKNQKKKALEYIDLAIAELPKIEPFKEERNRIVNL